MRVCTRACVCVCVCVRVCMCARVRVCVCARQWQRFFFLVAIWRTGHMIAHLPLNFLPFFLSFLVSFYISFFLSFFFSYFLSFFLWWRWWWRWRWLWLRLFRMKTTYEKSLEPFWEKVDSLTKYRHTHNVESINIWYDFPPEQRLRPCALGGICIAVGGVIFFQTFRAHFFPNFEKDTFSSFACHFRTV